MAMTPNFCYPPTLLWAQAISVSLSRGGLRVSSYRAAVHLASSTLGGKQSWKEAHWKSFSVGFVEWLHYFMVAVCHCKCNAPDRHTLSPNTAKHEAKGYKMYAMFKPSFRHFSMPWPKCNCIQAPHISA
ncbi:unnamed protein product [Protopolystoma xenopodis]|uniref:Uncharacterized protein n=1 Tax=Protopolystoma xenopodis TaxID=117903 RepID=A0A448XHV1_9PLAT|nr:unnamed protein product [Protopolystoma xenopodis]